MESHLPIFASLVFAAAAAAKPLQSCLTLCDPIDGSPPVSPVPGILQARTLEWVAISFSNARKWKVKVKLFSGVWLLATPWTAAHQAPPSMGFSRQEYWSGVPLPSPVVFAFAVKQKKKSYCQDQCQGAYTFWFFFLEFYDFMIVLICSYQIQAQRDWLVQSYITNKVVETDHA